MYLQPVYVYVRLHIYACVWPTRIIFEALPRFFVVRIAIVRSFVARAIPCY